MASRRASPALLLASLALALGACGDDDDDAGRIAGTPEPSHAREVEQDPFALACRDLRRQTLHPESAKLVIRAEFALAQVPDLRQLVRTLTLNRAGRSVYYGLVEECKGRPGSFKPARAAIAGVLAGEYRAARNRPG